MGGHGGLRQVRASKPAAPLTGANAETRAPAHPLRALLMTAAQRSAAAQTTRRLVPEPEPCSYEAEVAAIVARYATAIDDARRSTKPRHEIEAIIRALRERQASELAAVRKRRKARAARRPKGHGVTCSVS